MIIVRFVLEAAGVSLDTTRFLSASVVSALAIIYVGAVAPLRGVTRFRQLALPALVLSAWLGGWTALALIISGVFQLPGSHFAHAPPEPLYPSFWFHVFEHVAVIPFASLATLGVMAIPYFLHRWPVTVAPASVLGGLVTLAFCRRGHEPCPNDGLGMELQRRPAAERPLSRRHRAANGSSSPPGSSWLRHSSWVGSGGYGSSWRHS